MLADAAAIKVRAPRVDRTAVIERIPPQEVTSDRAKFSKPLAVYKILMFYGSNVVVTEGEEWKRHRKISAPSFSERNNRLVWDETISIMRELCEDVWAGKSAVPISSIVDLTVPIALFVIGVAGFGKRMSWHEDSYVPEGFRFSFKVRDVVCIQAVSVFPGNEQRILAGCSPHSLHGPPAQALRTRILAEKSTLEAAQ